MGEMEQHQDAVEGEEDNLLGTEGVTGVGTMRGLVAMEMDVNRILCTAGLGTMRHRNVQNAVRARPL